MMATWWTERRRQAESLLTTEQTLELVRHDLDGLEKRVALIEATLAALRAEHAEEAS